MYHELQIIAVSGGWVLLLLPVGSMCHLCPHISAPMTHEFTTGNPQVMNLEEEAEKMVGIIKTYTKCQNHKLETYKYILGSDVRRLVRWGRIYKGEIHGWKHTSKSIDGRTLRVWVKL
jgi:hypothetical protein